MKELLDRLDSRELSEWIAYDRLEPLPDTWLQNGIVAHLIAALGGEKTKPHDWIPKPSKASKTNGRATEEQTANYLTAIFGKPTEE